MQKTCCGWIFDFDQISRDRMPRDKPEHNRENRLATSFASRCIMWDLQSLSIIIFTFKQKYLCTGAKFAGKEKWKQYAQADHRSTSAYGNTDNIFVPAENIASFPYLIPDKQSSSPQDDMTNRQGVLDYLKKFSQMKAPCRLFYLFRRF